MLKRIWALGLILAVLSLSGCALRTVEEMYSLPKRSEEYDKLQSAIDIAMAGLDYAAPLSGVNRQTLQSADLDGDGREEYLVFAQGKSDRPLQLLIFQRSGEDAYQIQEVIGFRGTSFEQVEYVEIDDQPGCEIVLGRQLSDQVVGPFLCSPSRGETSSSCSAPATPDLSAVTWTATNGRICW